jgi:hypothetical protein
MTGALFDEVTGHPIVPALLDLGGARAFGDVTDRAVLAEFVVDPAHGRFARNAANRLIAELLGRGLVEPVDDHRISNPPVSSAMLDALTDRFHATAGDLVELLVWVASSHVYRLGLGGDDDERIELLAANESRPLTPDAFARAVVAVTGRQSPQNLPASPLARELALANGPIVHQLLANGGTTVDAIFTICEQPQERLTELWRTILSRSPRPDEAACFRAYAAGDLAAFRDLAYALLAGREFGHRR